MSINSLKNASQTICSLGVLMVCQGYRVEKCQSYSPSSLTCPPPVKQRRFFLRRNHPKSKSPKHGSTMRMTGLVSFSTLFVVCVLTGNLHLSDVSIIQQFSPQKPSLLLRFQAKNWRYWSNIGCYEFSFERTVFFELTDTATPLSCDGCEGSQLCKWPHNVSFI